MKPLTRHDSNRGSRGFSFLEVTSLIVILGLLAAVAFPIVDRMKENIRNRRFMDDIKQIRDAAAIYSTEHGDYPEARESDRAPEGIDEIMGPFDWERPTPFGGEWEWVKDRHGVVSAIAVHDPEVSEDHLKRFDTAEDDGDLHTGEFRFISDIRYGYVLEGGDDDGDEPAGDPADGEEVNAEIDTETNNAS